jgi:hypothetical protein
MRPFAMSTFLRVPAAFLCITLAASVVGLAACTSTKGDVTAAIPPEPLSDDAYAPVYDKWFRKVSLVDQFQKRLDASAVLFTDDMRKAYAERWVRIRGDREAEIEALAGGKLAVFVSVFTPETDYLDLDNSQLWSHSLQLGAQGASPVAVKRLFAKSAFSPFFPFVNRWTSDFLVLFDASSSSLQGAGLVNAPQASFQMRSALASLEFTWK